MEAAAAQQVQESSAGSSLWREGMGLIGRKMAAAADEIERLTSEREANTNEIRRLYDLVNHWYREASHLREAERCRMASGLSKAEICYGCDCDKSVERVERCMRERGYTVERRSDETSERQSWSPPPRELTLYGTPDNDVGINQPECYTAISIGGHLAAILVVTQMADGSPVPPYAQETIDWMLGKSAVKARGES